MRALKIDSVRLLAVCIVLFVAALSATAPAMAACGNSVVEPGEQCDDGGSNGSFNSCCNTSCFFTGKTPDVIVGDLTGVSRYGEVGGITAYSVGTTSCNLGSCWLKWISNNAEHPVIGQNLYRLKNGRFEQMDTLAAFRLAGDEKADFVELDVQESSDGEVLVVHDADLMKLAKDPRKIWDTDAASLRALDIGSWFDAKFSTERVATLAEALAACKGRSKVVVELKSYGHNDRLEERVAQIVEAAGMQNDCIFMSLDHDMVRKMKQLRPNWRCGYLIATARGDLTSLGGDFLAVEARMATRRFVRLAHRAGQDVYVWTVNDPAWMLTMMSHGVDGLITDKPELARQVIERRAKMSDAQRFLLALLVRVGARKEVLEDAAQLRP